MQFCSQRGSFCRNFALNANIKRFGSPKTTYPCYDNKCQRSYDMVRIDEFV